MNDSIVLLNESSDDRHRRRRDEDDDDDQYEDFIVPLQEEDDSAEELSAAGTSSATLTAAAANTHLKKAPAARTRARKSNEKAESENRKAELKALKLAQKKAREKEAERKKAERLEKRLAKEAEKLAKKQQREATRANQPKSLIKKIMIVVDDRIRKLDKKREFDTQARENLLDADETISIDYAEECQTPYSISWNLPADSIEEIITADEIVIALPISEVFNLVRSSLNGGCEIDLRSYFENVKRRSLGKKIILIIVGWDRYLLDYKTWMDRRHRQQCAGTAGASSAVDLTKGLKSFDDEKPVVTPEEIDRALVELQMIVGVSHMTAADMKELAVVVQHMTKAIAEKPEKLRKRAMSWQQDFGYSKAVKLGADGSGRRELWRRIVQQPYGRQDVPFAEAVVKKYANPHELIEAYRSCGGAVCDAIASKLLAGVDEAGKKRYEASRRVHMMFTCRDPEAILDK